MPPEPLPHPNEDPDHLAARQSKADLAATVKAAREDYRLSDLARAEQISAAYERHVQEVRAAYERIVTRQRARLEYLESLLPVGPGIAAGTSPADAAVLMAAFRGAFATAQEASRDKRRALLAEAERFGDDMMRRAVMTAALDEGQMDIVKSWTELHLDKADLLEELQELRRTVAGISTAALFAGQDFKPMPKPLEAHDLPILQASVAAGVLPAERTLRPGVVGRQGPASRRPTTAR